ncbi:LptA/OstA family protein [Tistrella bauzanensis]|uniref:LptA/OstA family protein n=1 Tax=Tistrella arctica TaxID=3133430 RepID=A0ABU9YKE3_9PROT
MTLSHPAETGPAPHRAGRRPLPLIMAALAAMIALTAGTILAPGIARAQSALRTSSIDTTQPIEITAQQSLEWSDVDRVATFRGDVKAVQGTMTLYADVLKVHVSGETNQAPPADTAGTGGSDAPASPGGGGLADAAGEISKIEAEGNVQIITPNESARGGVGIYDVSRGVVTLTGAVKLTQGRSQLEGERLVLDLNKGNSTLESGRKGPVRGLFVPEKRN